MIHGFLNNLLSLMALETVVCALRFNLFFIRQLIILFLITSFPLFVLDHFLYVSLCFSVRLYSAQKALWQGLHRGEYKFPFIIWKKLSRVFSSPHLLQILVIPLSFLLEAIVKYIIMARKYQGNNILKLSFINHYEINK